jgi:transposase InsO family protein
MAGDDSGEASSGWIEVELREVVKDVDDVGADLDDVAGRKAGSPGAFVVVAADRAHRCKASERFQDGWVTDVATMNNEVRFSERNAFPWDEAPNHLIRDRDGAFGPAYTHRIRAMGIRDHPTAPRSPWQNGHVERLIGSIRRESLDHLVVFDEAQLRRVLRNYASYYNQVRTHLSLRKNAPDFRRPQKIGRIAAIPILGGLHHQ